MCNGEKYPNKRIIIISSLIAIFIGAEVYACYLLYTSLATNENNNIHNKMSTTVNSLLNQCTEDINSIKYLLARNAAQFRINGIYISSSNFNDFLQFDIYPGEPNIEYVLGVPKIYQNELS